MGKKRFYIRLFSMFSIGAMLLLAGCSLGDYPSLLQGCTLFNSPPAVPAVPSGPSNGDIDVSYAFSSSAVDPDGNDVALQFDWGDGSLSGWSDYVASGATVSLSHSYLDPGSFQVKARAKDRTGATSGWSGAHLITIAGGGGTGGQAGTIKWQWKTEPGLGIGTTPAIGPDGNIYIITGTSPTIGQPLLARLVCISPTGSMLWESQELDHVGASDPVIATDGTIYVVGYYKLYAFSPNGALKWEWTTPPNGDPYPHSQICGVTLGPDGTIYTAHCGSGAYHRYLFALNPDGSMKWARDLADPNVGNGARALTVGKNGVLYSFQAPDYHPALYAYNPANGAVIWNLDLAGYDINVAGFAIGADGTIYLSSYANGGKLFAISPGGKIFWDVSLPNPGIPSIGPAGTIYLVGASGYVDGDLYALTSSGVLQWHKGNALGSHSIALAADGTIYGALIFADSSNFAAVNSDGSVRWTLDIPVSSGSPAIGPDGTIYVTGGAYPGVLTAIQGSAPLASSAWPRARHDNRNTGAYGGS